MRFEMSGGLAARARDVIALPFESQHLFFAPDDSMAAAEGTPEAFRVLIVEDDYLVASDLEIALTEAGFKVVGIAASADEAAALAGLRAPSVAVMDIRLTGKRDGIDAALELFRVHGIRSVFATAHSDDEAQRRAAPAQPLGWIEKPYSVGAVVAFIADLAGSGGKHQ